MMLWKSARRQLTLLVNAAIQESLNNALDKNAILIAFIESVTAELKGTNKVSKNQPLT